MWRLIPEGAEFAEHVLLRDGTGLLLRVARGEADVDGVLELLQRSSPESRRMRFMGGMGRPSRETAAQLCRVALPDQAALVAQTGRPPDERMVGIGSYVRVSGRPVAEVAFLVEDAFQGRGIGTLLLERLAGIAAAHNLVGFEAEVLADNQAMVEVFRESGFEVQQAVLGGTVHVTFPVKGSAVLRTRAELRDRIATANSLAPLLRPRTVAVVGASRDPNSAGGLVFRHILAAGYTGTAYPVNPRATAIHGVKAYPDAAALPEPVDLAIIAVPAEQVLEAVQQCMARGVRGLVVLSAGFAEAGDAGARRQQELVRLVRSHGVRLVGPNCLGLANTHPQVRLNASLTPELPARGRIGFLSHSGALGVVILAYAAERGLGFSTFVSVGNRADVSGNDLLEYWEEDPDTDLILLYLETFGNPRRFARIARRVSARKPVLCVKSARSRRGQEVARAHIGAVPLGEAEVEALFTQAGVIRADTLEEMFDVAALLAHQPLPAGNRVAIVTNSGGVATLCADACEARRLEVTATPGIVDLGSVAHPAAYETAVQDALQSPEADAVIVIFACVGPCRPDQVGRAVRRGVLRAGVEKPVLLCLMGAAGAIDVTGPGMGVATGDGAGGPKRAGGDEPAFDEGPAGEGLPERPARVFPAYRFPEAAAIALARAVAYATWRRRPAGHWPVELEGIDGAAARRLVEDWYRARGAGHFPPPGGTLESPWVLQPDQVHKLLGCFGLQAAEPAPAEVRLRVHLDPSFGPVMEAWAGQGPAASPGGQVPCRGQPSPPWRVVRLTPLTDRDAGELAEILASRVGTLQDAPAAKRLFSDGVAAVLLRISALIEEVPWLTGFEGWLRFTGGDTVEAPGTSPAARPVLHGAAITLF